MPQARRVPWRPAELRVLDRCVCRVLDGRYDSVSRAAKVCLSELTRLRAAPDKGGALPPRAYRTVYTRIRRETLSPRRGALGSFWSADEQVVVDRFVHALVNGRYRRAQEAADACCQEFARLRRLRPSVWRAAVPRTPQAVFMRVVEGAQAAGRKSQRTHWTPSELLVIDRHARALARGRFRDAQAAAASCHSDVNLLVPRPPARSRTAVHARLVRRARDLGWFMDNTRWLPQERRLLERCARRVVQDRAITVRAAARACHASIIRLYDRFRASHPSGRDGYVRRTYNAIESYVERRAGELGRRVNAGWLPDEDAVVDRYAQALLAGQYKDGPAAARAGRRELARRRRSWQKADPRRFNRTRVRSHQAVRTRIQELAHTHKRRWPKTAWTDEEMRLLQRWIPWYKRYRRRRDFPAMKTAAEGTQEELERMGSRRSVAACYGRFQKEWLRLQGPA
jgi:hypothetical protein